jgi:hypothetical protein
MAPDNKGEPIKITLDDLAKISAVPSVPVLAPSSPAGPGSAKVYGSINEAVEEPAQSMDQQAHILLQAWFYLGLAGFLGALLGWAIAEPGFVDGAAHRWGNWAIIPLVITLECVGFSVAESIVERSPQKVLTRGLLALPLGIVMAFLFDIFAELIFNIGLAIAFQAGVHSARNPSVWVIRGLAWTVFGAAGGVVYGIVGQSSKKAMYGVLGGVIGAGIGGMVFDPIALLTHGGAASRAVGFALLGLATGIGIGLVESALKDRWLYVTAGPLAGKQFILYKPRTLIGSGQNSDIYLFKDSSILPQHALVEIAGSRVQIQASGPLFVSGSPTRLHVLQSGNILQIGRYAFRYQERHRK